MGPDAFLRGLMAADLKDLARPDPWLVYADWLEDRGEVYKAARARELALFVRHGGRPNAYTLALVAGWDDKPRPGAGVTRCAACGVVAGILGPGGPHLTPDGRYCGCGTFEDHSPLPDEHEGESMADTKQTQHDALKGALAPQVVQQVEALGIDWSKIVGLLNTLLPLILALLPKTPPGAQPGQPGVP